MALGDTLRRIVASDNFILNAAGALVGIKNPNANGLDLRVDAPAAYLPSILAQSGVPVILPSSGSSNATGQITLTTALSYQPSGTVSLYLPAGVVVGDATGGLKAVVFSSTTVCQIVGAPATANASYTQTTGAPLTLLTVAVPGNSMGANGALRVRANFSVPNNANSKVWVTRFGGSVAMFNQNIAGNNGLTAAGMLVNRGSTSAQVAPGFGGDSNNGAASVYLSIDTTQNQNLTYTCQMATATDYVILEAYTVEVLPSA